MNIFSAIRNYCFGKPVKVETAGSVGALVIGVESSKFAGDCPGAVKDTSTISGVLRKYTNNIQLLINSAATKKAVSAGLKNVVKNDLAIIYYSGHGGNAAFATVSLNEVDGKDEFLCLYDTYLLDNDIWNIIKNAKGRVFIIFDCCHSSDMFAAPSTMMLQAKNTPKDIPDIPGKTLTVDADLDMIQWAGCHESTVSYGSAFGGMLTNCIKRHYKADLSYSELWEKVANDSSLLCAQTPYQIVTNKTTFSNTKFLQ